MLQGYKVTKIMHTEIRIYLLCQRDKDDKDDKDNKASQLGR